MKILDSTFLIDILRNKSDNARRILQSESALLTTQINMYEVLSGIFISNSSSENLKAQELFENIRVLPLDDTAIIEAAKIRAQLMKSGEMIEDTDCLIAGCALSKGVDTIITKNTKHFKRIKGLKVESY